MKKKEIIHQLDAQILEWTEDPVSLEDIILETEETQDMILEKINQIDTYLEMRAEASTSHTLNSYTTIVYLIISTTLPQGSTEPNTVEWQLPSTAANTELTAVTSHRTSPIVASVSLTSFQSQSEANPYPQTSSRLPKLTLPIRFICNYVTK